MSRSLTQRVSLALALAAVLALGLAFAPLIASAVSPDPVVAAWNRGREAGAYRFTSEVQIVTTPNGSVTNVGRRGRSDTLHLEGSSNLRDQSLEMQLWSGGGTATDPNNSIGLRFADGKTMMREGNGAWKDAGDLTETIAPGGDFTQYLRAVKNVRTLGHDQRAGISFTRYAFEIDGLRFAEYMRDQTEVAMQRQGDLLPGMHIDTPRYYRDMIGTGELWVGPDGLPLRQMLDLQFPELRGQRQSSLYTVDFEAWGKGTVGPGSFFDAVRRYAPSPLAAINFSIAVLFSAMLVHFRRSRRLLQGLSLVLVVSVMFGPLLGNVKTASFLTAQSASAAAMETERSQAEQQQRAREASSASTFDPHQSPLEAAEQRTRTAAAVLRTNTQARIVAATTDNGTDTDDDGLTDFQEERVNTDRTYNDSDEDGVLDGIEAKGFLLGGKTWYLDPNKVDTNEDGVADGLECRPDETNGPCTLDTDNDGIPDVFDADNDNDGVTDGRDMSIFTSTASAAAFNDANPLRLTLRNLSAGKPTFVDFQFKPRNPAHLGYATSVLDWPSDAEGQFRDIDNKTFADVQAAKGEAGQINDGDGDMKLVPMLEIRMTGTPNYLPPQSDLTPYNISYNDYTANGATKVVFVPVTLQTNEKSGSKEAFTARMRYLPVATAAVQQQVRLVWGVQTLIDIACDETAPNAAATGCGADGYIHNVPQIIQSYYDDWTLTGLNVREESGTDVAMVYEDPAVDTNLKNDAPLFSLAQGLDASFLAGRDQDTNNQRDVTVNEIARRFDRDTNSGVSETQRWAIPNVLQVEKSSYPTSDKAVQTMAVTETKRILTSRFNTVWQSDKTIKPLLLYATEQRYRSLNLERTRTNDGYVGLSGTTLTVDMAPSGKTPVELYTTARVNWMPYCGVGTSSPTWEPCDQATYANELTARYGQFLDTPGDNNDPLMLSGNMALIKCIPSG